MTLNTVANIRSEFLDHLVNGIYPPEYLRVLIEELEGERQVSQRDSYWWASTERYGSVDPADGNRYLSVADGGQQTFEVLEIDLGRARQVNYLTMDVLRAPLDIEIEYDASSARSYDKNWQSVVPTEYGKFDSRIYFEATARNPWFTTEFYFGDADDRPITTRYLRIKFLRRTENWPTSTTQAFRWAVLVKSLRTARSVRRLSDALGLLIEPTLDDLGSRTVYNTTGTDVQQIRQRFSILPEHVRGENVPNIHGISFLTSVNDGMQDEVRWQWDVYDVTDSDAGVPIHTGTFEGASHDGDCWIDLYFQRTPITGDLTRIYEVRLTNLNPDASESFYYNRKPFSMVGRQLPGLYDFTNGATSIDQAGDDFRDYVRNGTFVYKGNDKRDSTPSQVTTTSWSGGTGSIDIAPAFAGYSRSNSTAFVVYPLYMGSDGYDPTSSLALRVWADVADSGRDVIGNSYRSAIIYDAASHVADEDSAGWLSAPQPSPEAVESMFFDVRQQYVGKPSEARVIDALRVAPRTPGMFMHVYYTDQNLHADRAPDTQDEWDAIEWTPVNATYVLRFDEVIQLPRQIKASYVKLEFTNLQPLPIKVPEFPKPLSTRYRRYPSWVEAQFMDANFSSYRRMVEDWFIRSHDVNGMNVLQYLTDPVKEFEYKQREFLTSLASGELGADVAVGSSGFVDVDSRILTDPVTSSKIYFKTTDMFQGSLLGTVDRSTMMGTAMAAKANIGREQIEIPDSSDFGSVRSVSTVADRVSESYSYLAQTPMWFNRRCLHLYRTEVGEFSGKAYFAGIKRVQFFRNDYTVRRNDLIIEDILHDSTMVEESSWLTWEKDEGTLIPEATSDGLGGLLPNIYVTYSVGDLTVVDEPHALTGVNPSPLLTPGVATNIVGRSGTNGNGVGYARGDDYDIAFATDVYGRTVTSITRSTSSNRIVVPRMEGMIFNDGGVVSGRAIIEGIDDNHHIPSEYEDGFDVLGVAAPSAVSSHQMVEAGTATGVSAVTGTDTKQSIDSGAVTGVAAHSAVEVFPPVDAATVTGVAAVSGLESSNSHVGTITGVMQLHEDYRSIVLADNPVALWPLDESSGTTANQIV